MSLESTFQKKLIEQLKRIPCSYWVKVSQRAVRGTPDILGHINGLFVALELKRDRHEKPTALQRLALQQIARGDGIAFVVHPENAESILKFLKAMGKLRNRTRLDVHCLQQIESRCNVAAGHLYDSDRKIITLSE